MKKNFKAESTGARFLPVVLEEQIRPAGFECALRRLLDRVDLSRFEARYRTKQEALRPIAPACG